MPPLILPITQENWEEAKSIGSYRTHRDRKTRQDKWGQGIIPDAHEQGCLAEITLANHLDLPWNKEQIHDIGHDLKLPGGSTVQIKTTIKLNMPAFRARDKLKSELYVFCKTRWEDREIDYIGWAPRQMLLDNRKEVQLPSGKNFQPTAWKSFSEFIALSRRQNSACQDNR